MDSYYKTRVRPKGQITLPSEVRNYLNLDEGDDLVFSVNEQGLIVIQRAKIIPPDQAWFWTERWQRMERQVEEDIEAGRVQRYPTVEEALTALENSTNAGD